MTGLDEQVEAAVALLKAAGRTASIDPDAPDYVKQAFLNLIRNVSEVPRKARRRYDEDWN